MTVEAIPTELTLYSPQGEAVPPERPAQLAIASHASGRSREEVRKRLQKCGALLWPWEGEDAWCGPWSTIDFSAVMLIRESLIESGLAPGTVNCHLAAVKSAAKHAFMLNLMDDRTHRRIEMVPGVKGEAHQTGRYVETGEVAVLFHVCKADPKRNRGLRDAAILALGFGGGLRRSEIINLEMQDYPQQSGSPGLLRIRHGKGDKPRELHLPPGAQKHVDAWVEARGNHPGPLICRVNKSGRISEKGVSTQAMVARIKARAIEAGIEEFSAHDMRRHLLTRLIDEGQMRSAQIVAGHVDISTTSRYDRRGEERARRVMRKLDIPF